jgi:hypothetical protein
MELADPLSATASVVGIAAAGLHGVKLLFEDLQGYKDAPTTIQRLRYEVWAVERALESLKGIDQQSFDILGPKVAQHARAVVVSCSNTCIWFREKLHRWTRHSTEPELASQDKVRIAFQQTQIDIMSEKLLTATL